MYHGFRHKNCYSLSLFNESRRPQNNLIGSYLNKCGKIHFFHFQVYFQVNSNTPRASQGICQQKELCPTTAAPPASQDKGLLQLQKRELHLQPPPLAWRMQVTTESFKSPSQKLLYFFLYIPWEIFSWPMFSNSYQHYYQLTRKPHSPWLPIWIFWYETGITQTARKTI